VTRTHPPLDPELTAVLTVVHEHLSPSIAAEDIEELRANPMFAVADEDLTRNGTVELQNFSISGPPGAPKISLLVLRPVGLAAGAPVFYYMHGGGMIIGNSRTGVGSVLDWAVDNDAVVVSVEYRLAPEHPDPAPIEDCYAGLLWTHEHAAEIGGNRDRIVVTGASAGGGLAAGASPSLPVCPPGSSTRNVTSPPGSSPTGGSSRRPPARSVFRTWGNVCRASGGGWRRRVCRATGLQFLR
jgi:acetyl esterase/lipase